MTPPIFIIGESIKGADYRDIVLPHLIREIKRFMGYEPFLFMKDGAPAHKTNLTQQFSRDSNIPFIPREEWPGNSPDLNPIDNLWDLLQQHVTPPGTHNIIDRHITTWARLWSRDVKVAQYCAAQVSMLGRMSELDDSKGGSIAH